MATSKVSRGFTAVALLLCAQRSWSYTWPDPRVDLLEEILYLQDGYRSYGLITGVSPCSSSIAVADPFSSRNDAAEWLRTSFHDAATANVAEGTGGIDASIGFETNRDENPGAAFNSSLSFFTAFQSVSSSMADLIVLGAQLAVASCSNGSVQVPYRAGRIDATGPAPPGVPTPTESLLDIEAAFQRMGFNRSEMIGLVACGHTIGGVHSLDFPLIVDPPASGDDTLSSFDSTLAVYDNNIAKEYVTGTSQDPLISGHNVSARVDARVFGADNGVMLGDMARSTSYFFNTCQSLLERMFNTVAATVELTDIITPVPVKPGHLNISINTDDDTMLVSGEIRVQTNGAIKTSPDQSVLVHLQPRSPSFGQSSTIAWTKADFTSRSLYPQTPTFAFYLFNTTVPAASGVSSFTVEIAQQNSSATFDNGGKSFPLSDLIAPQLGSSCVTFSDAVVGDNLVFNSTLILQAAALNDAKFDSLVLNVPVPVAQQGTVTLTHENQQVIMNRISTSGEKSTYSLYEAAFSFPGLYSETIMTYDIIGVRSAAAGGNVTNSLNLWASLFGCRST